MSAVQDTCVIPARRFVPALLLGCIVLLSLLGWRSIGRSPPGPSPTLNANLWMQTSGEYVACCLQTYQLAADRIERDLRELTEPGEGRKLPPAVIMDLDETVLDNGPYQSYLIDTGQQHSSELFSWFVTEHAASIGLVPGAKQFIDRIESDGLTVVYVTNRTPAIRDSTIATLRQRNLNTLNLAGGSDSRLFMKVDESSKVARFRDAQSRYRILAMVGDQLGDFDGDRPAEREHAGREGRQFALNCDGKWGTRWFILPNPAYGDWLQSLGNDPACGLRRFGE